MQEVLVTIENGQPTIKVSGVTGSGCKDLTRDLEKALGEVQTSKPTAEFNAKHNQRAKANR